jgi:hypothetical protein
MQREWLKPKLLPDMKPVVIQTALAAILNVFAGMSNRDFIVRIRYIQYARSAATLYQEWKSLKFTDSKDIDLKIGFYLGRIAWIIDNQAVAIFFYQLALDSIPDRESGHVWYPWILNNLALLYASNGNQSKALNLQSDCLNVLFRILQDIEHPEFQAMKMVYHTIDMTQPNYSASQRLDNRLNRLSNGTAFKAFVNSIYAFLETSQVRESNNWDILEEEQSEYPSFNEESLFREEEGCKLCVDSQEYTKRLEKICVWWRRSSFMSELDGLDVHLQVAAELISHGPAGVNNGAQIYNRALVDISKRTGMILANPKRGDFYGNLANTFLIGRDYFTRWKNYISAKPSWSFDAMTMAEDAAKLPESEAQFLLENIFVGINKSTFQHSYQRFRNHENESSEDIRAAEPGSPPSWHELEKALQLVRQYKNSVFVDSFHGGLVLDCIQSKPDLPVSMFLFVMALCGFILIDQYHTAVVLFLEVAEVMQDVMKERVADADILGDTLELFLALN